MPGTFWNVESPETEPEESAEQPEVSLKENPLVSELIIQKNRCRRLISNAAHLIAPVIGDSPVEGHDWVISVLKDSDYKEIQSEIEMAKAMVFIEQRDIPAAIALLKSFEKKDRRMMTIAACNLSFLYLLEKDYPNADKYCDIALKFDRYNCKALVNKGNCFYHQNDFDRAKENYLEAIGVQADCLEALYNLAFVNKKLNAFMEALTALEKLKSIVNNQPEVLFQLASIFELLGRHWFPLTRRRQQERVEVLRPGVHGGAQRPLGPLQAGGTLLFVQRRGAGLPPLLGGEPAAAHGPQLDRLARNLPREGRQLPPGRPVLRSRRQDEPPGLEVEADDCELLPADGPAAPGPGSLQGGPREGPGQHGGAPLYR